MNNLTAKQEKFCNNIALEGMNQSDAYRDAYDASKMKPETIKVKASELMKVGNITVTIKELKAKLTDKAIEGFAKTKIELLGELETIKKDSLNDKERKIAIDCIKEQGKLLGFYEDIVNLKGDKNNPIETKISVEFIKPKKEN